MSSASSSSAASSALLTTHTLIIGSGPCGLGACWRLEELSRLGVSTAAEWLCVDSSPTAGGLASSEKDEKGFLWDMGGHVIFSHYTYFTRLLDHLLPQDGWNTLQREAWVWLKERWIPYPFQQNIHRLPKEDVEECLKGLIELDKNRSTSATAKKPANFQEWLLSSFGTGLCNLFMFPYNMKVWAYPPTLMNTEWMGERVATVDTSKIISNLLHQRDELGWGPNNLFRFPKHGGTGAIWKALFEALPEKKFLFNKTVVGVDATQKIVSFQDGTKIKYENLISTMPLDCLCRVTTSLPGYTPADLSTAASQFRYSSSHIIGFGLQGKIPDELKTKCWMYFSEANIPFYRATILSNYSKYVCPDPENAAGEQQQWSIMTEVSESSMKPVDMKTIVSEVREALMKYAKLIPADGSSKIISEYHRRLEYGYPTPFLGRDALITPISVALEKQSIFSRGRFGTWKYEVSNQDHSLMLGVETVDRIIAGCDAEMTRNHSGLVNAGRDTQPGGRVPNVKGTKLEKK